MRKYQEFKQMWLGKKVRDGQCVSLFREYTEGFHDTPQLERLGATGGALGLFTRFNTDVGQVSRQVFDCFTYTQGTADRPQEGDAVIFGASSNNSFGHVGIMDSLNSDGTINVMDQDGLKIINRTGQEPVANITRWQMSRVIGWLRLKGAKAIATAAYTCVENNPPPGAKIAPSDRQGQIGDYWFNPSTNRWMQLSGNGWNNI
jgi:hypothetical protein